MDSLADLVGCDDHPDAPALRAAGDPVREYDYRRLRTDSRRTGNLLRHLGVRDGSTVAVADDPAPEAVLAFLGTALLGGTTRFDPPRDVDARVLVAPTGELGEFDLPPGGQRVGYGAEPADPSHQFFERDVWSENPGFPATAVAPDSPVLAAEDGERLRTLSHAALLAAAREVAADLGPADVVAVRTSLAAPGTVTAGIIAPLLAGACVFLPGGGSAEHVGTVAIVPAADSEAPESRHVVASDRF